MIPANQPSLPPRLNNNNGCHFLSEALFLATIIPIPYSDLRGSFTKSKTIYFRISDHNFKNGEIEAQKD